MFFSAVQRWVAYQWRMKRREVETQWLQPRGDGAACRRGMRRFRQWYVKESNFDEAMSILKLRVIPRRSWRLKVDTLWNWYTVASWRRRSKLLPRRRHRVLKVALSYWCAEARWRIQRHKWLRRQVRYMDELQHVLDNLGDGQKWAKRLLSLGLEPQDVAHLGPFHPRCQKTLEKALQRSSPSAKSPVSRMRVLSPGVDSYLEDVLSSM
jgi:hypothetical protein